MIRRNFTIALLLTLALSSSAFATNKARKIDRALSRNCVSKTETGVSIVSLSSGFEIYSKNRNKPLIPASVMKLFTTGAALKNLGPGYKFKTYIMTTGGIKNGRVGGDLYIKGGGDPKLTPEIVWRIAAAINRRGIKSVAGDLVIDNSFFDGIDKAPAWRKNRSTRAYDAKIAALSVSFNSVAVEVFAGAKEGAQAIVGVEPESSYIKIRNSVTTSNSSRGFVSVKRIDLTDSMIIEVNGSKRVGDKPTLRYINVNDPYLFAAKTFRDFLRKEGVAIEGGTRRGVAPGNAKLLYTNKSAPLRTILGQLNRFSNNFVAEQIAKTMSAEISSAPGNHADAVKIIENFAKTLGPMNGSAFYDASGLSRKNRVTAHQTTKLIYMLSKKFDLGPDFIASLAIMGLEGSVKKRLKNSHATKLARAKTGSLSKVSNLAGVVASANGKKFAFAIFLNNNSCGQTGADKIEDQIISILHHHGGAR